MATTSSSSNALTNSTPSKFTQNYSDAQKSSTPAQSKSTMTSGGSDVIRNPASPTGYTNRDNVVIAAPPSSGTRISIGSGGNVQVGSAQYVGNAIVPGTGLTANQLSNQTRQQSVALYNATEGKQGIPLSQFGRASFSGTLSSTQTSQSQSTMPSTPSTSSNPFQMGGTFFTKEGPKSVAPSPEIQRLNQRIIDSNKIDYSPTKEQLASSNFPPNVISAINQASATSSAFAAGVLGTIKETSRSYYPSLYYEIRANERNQQLVNDFQINPTNYPSTAKSTPLGTEYTLSPEYYKSYQKESLGLAKQERQDLSFGTKLIGTITEFSVGALQAAEGARTFFTEQAGYALYGGLKSSNKSEMVLNLDNKTATLKETKGSLYAKQFSDILNPKREGQIYFSDLPNYTLAGKVGQYSPAIVAIGQMGYEGISSFKSGLAEGLTKSQAASETISTTLRGGSLIQFKSMKELEAIQVANTMKFAIDSKGADWGQRIVSGNKAADFFGSTSKVPMGGYQTETAALTKVNPSGSFRTTGISAQEVYATGFWSGRTFTSTSTSQFRGTGQMLSDIKGLTPSIGYKEDLITANVQNIKGLNGFSSTKVNLFPEGFTPIVTKFGGATYQPTPNYVASSSGKFGGINYKFDYKMLDTGMIQMNKAYSLEFKPESKVLLQLSQPDFFTGPGGGGSRGAGNQKQVSLLSQTPVFSTKPMTITRPASTSSSLTGIGTASALSTVTATRTSTLPTITSLTNQNVLSTTNQLGGQKLILEPLVKVRTGTTTRTKTTTATITDLTSITGGGLTTPGSPGIIAGFTPIVPIGWAGFPQLGGFAGPNYRKRGKKNLGFDIAPSFSGIITGIELKAPLKVSRTFGVSPTAFRGLPSTKQRKGKQPYFKFTDL